MTTPDVDQLRARYLVQRDETVNALTITFQSLGYAPEWKPAPFQHTVLTWSPLPHQVMISVRETANGQDAEILLTVSPPYVGSRTIRFGRHSLDKVVMRTREWLASCEKARQGRQEAKRKQTEREATREAEIGPVHERIRLDRHDDGTYLFETRSALHLTVAEAKFLNEFFHSVSERQEGRGYAVSPE